MDSQNNSFEAMRDSLFTESIYSAMKRLGTERLGFYCGATFVETDMKPEELEYKKKKGGSGRKRKG